MLWKASDRICGKRLKTLVPILVEAMERHGHLHLTAEIRTRLLAMSAATIDRALREVRDIAGGRDAVAAQRPPRSGAAFRSEPSPTGRIPRLALSKPTWPTADRRHVEASYKRFVLPTSRADRRNAPLLVREQKLLSEVLTELRRLLPVQLLGFDTDRQRVPERDGARLLSGRRYRVHTLPAVPQE